MIHPAGLGPNEESISSPACSIFQDRSFQVPINFSLTDVAERRLVRARPRHELPWTNSISAGVICLFIVVLLSRFYFGAMDAVLVARWSHSCDSHHKKNGL